MDYEGTMQYEMHLDYLTSIIRLLDFKLIIQGSKIENKNMFN